MLLVAADPVDAARLDLTGELRSIERELALMTDWIPIATRAVYAATMDDLHRELFRCRPHIIHVGGHVSADSLWLRATGQASRALSASSLAGLLAPFARDLRLVVMNACDSDSIAQTLTQQVACAIGFRGSLDDQSARIFAVTMYRTLAVGWSIERSFQQAMAVVADGVISPHAQLHCREDVDPSVLSLTTGRSVSRDIGTACGNSHVADSTGPDLGEVAQALASSDLVIVVGAGVHSTSGQSPWPVLARSLCEHARIMGASEEVINEIISCIDNHEYTEALSEIEKVLGASEFGHKVEQLEERKAASVPEALAALARLEPSLRGLITTNLDRAIERAFGGQWPMIPRPTDDIVQRERVIFKLHGTLEQRDTWIMTSEHYHQARYGRPLLRDALRAFFRARTLLFIGYHPLDPDFRQILHLLEFPGSRQPPRHYALMARGWLTTRSHGRMARAGIQVKTYANRTGELARTLLSLAG